MKKKTLLYIPALLLFVFALSVLVVHFSQMPERNRNVMRDFALPFVYNNERVSSLSPEVVSAGIKLNDKILSMNGRKLDSDQIWREELLNSQKTGQINLVMERKSEPDAPPEVLEFTLPLIKIEKNFSHYAKIVVGFIYLYFVPAFCIFVGFWVVFVRVDDFLAWLLLFLMLGFSCIGLEGYGGGTLVGTFAHLFLGNWALSMFLFGIYFPERLSLDIRFPWIKWIMITPLLVQMLIVFVSIFSNFTGIRLLGFLQAYNRFLGISAVVLNMLGIGLFFALLGYKSGTLQNPDARRRLKLMVYGTSVAMLPSLVIMLYGIINNIQGSFYDRAPWWFALIALLLMLVFPLTMAYVIIVHRAMDVRVVVRQGLQYALARNGVKALQFALLLAVIFGTLLIIRNYGEDISAQIAFVVGGLALIPLIDYLAKHLRIWIDRKFFREAYDAEQILTDLSEQVRTMVETKPLLETVSAKISESLHVSQVVLLLRSGNDFLPAYALGYKNLPPVTLDANDKTIEKLSLNETLTVYQDDEESWVNEDIEPGEREKLQLLNSQLLLPIGAKNELSGVISLSPKRSEEPFSANDLRLLKSVASQTGLALENSRLTEHIANEAVQKERLNREIEIAREVQERLFPQELPAVEGLDYYGACRPALGVGGDYYDFLELPEGKFGIAIGDISGKGIGASLMMASLQASLRGQTIHFKEELAEMMKHINTLLYEASTSNRYATFFYSQYDPKTRKLIYVNAGHNPPFLIRQSGEILKLEDGGAVVGMLPSMLVNYEQGEIELEPGDLIVGSTDGITEAMNPLEEEWSEDAMLEEIKKVTEKSAEEILHHIVAKADEFADGAKQHDDMTMIVIKVKSNS